MAFRRSTVRSRSAPPITLPLNFALMLRAAGRLLDRTVDLLGGLGGAAPRSWSATVSRSRCERDASIPFSSTIHTSIELCVDASNSRAAPWSQEEVIQVFGWRTI